MKFAWPAALLVCLLPFSASAVMLKQPIACDMGKNCFIQKYVDHDTSRGWIDYKCGHLSNDGHKGTDFRLLGIPQMDAGVNVLAAAAGEVIGVRDGVADVLFRHADKKKIAGKECGNGVVINHDNGWQTQYCHMKKDSIAVEKGQKVEQGAVLGQVGLSGNTDFPHLHLTLRKDGKTIDPFTNRGMESGCGLSGATNWEEKTLEKMEYVSPGLIGMGFTDKKPTNESVMKGENNATELPSDAPMMLFWAQIYGPKEGDTMTVKLHGTETGTLAESSHVFTGNKADYLMFVGKRLKEEAWPQDAYIGTITLTRDITGKETELLREEISFGAAPGGEGGGH